MSVKYEDCISDVFEQKVSIEKKGRASIAGYRVLLTIDDRHFFFNLPKVKEDEMEQERVVKEDKKNVVHNNGFTNDIVCKVRESYKIAFKSDVIKELSQLINEHYKSIITPNALLDLINPFLIKNGYGSNLNQANHAYIKYFVIDGLLKKNDDIYEIVRSNLIPKNKAEVNRGFLDELNMS